MCAKWTCCVPFCRNYKGKAPAGTAWHAFPKNEASRSTWMLKIEQEVGGHFRTTKHSRVCSQHFRQCDYRPHASKVKLLKRNAVPSVFPWSEDEMGSTNDSTQTGKSSDGTMPAVCNQSYNHHSTDANSYDAAIEHNGHAEFDSSHLTKVERTSPEPDTYELTELTPMAKQERLSPLPHAYNDNAEYRIITDLDNPFHVPIKESFGMASPMGLLGALPNNSEPSVYSEALKKCIISESFLYTLLRLIKCPQCGFGTNSEQMQKYENQGCILGVRLLCYNGHLVLDWRL